MNNKRKAIITHSFSQLFTTYVMLHKTNRLAVIKNYGLLPAAWSQDHANSIIKCLSSPLLLAFFVYLIQPD